MPTILILLLLPAGVVTPPEPTGLMGVLLPAVRRLRVAAQGAVAFPGRKE